MPIDASISNNLRPVQFDTTGLVNMIQHGQQRQMQQESHAQQMQLGAQELQQGQLKNRMQQQSMDEDALVRQAYAKTAQDKTGLDGLHALLDGKVSPQRLMAIDKENLDTKEKLGKVTKSNLENAQAQNTMVGETGAALMRLPADQRAAAWPGERARLIQQGAITADHAPEQYPGDQWLQLNVDHAMHADTQLTQEMKRRDDVRQDSVEQRAAAMGPDQLAKLQAETNTAQLAAAGQSPIQPAQAATIAGLAGAREETASYHKQRLAQMDAAAQKEKGPTGGQALLEQRFNQRRTDESNKQMAIVQGKENDIHAARLKLGEELKDPNITQVQRTAKLAQMTMTGYQVQSFQSRKADIAGAATPPQAIQDKIPEGHQMPTPDGHVWQKQGGIVYFVK